MSVQRFTLGITQLDDAGWGLDGASGFVLDSSLLDSTDVLDGGQFLTLATASASLDGATASATSQTTNPVSASAQLGAAAAQATSKTINFASAQATLSGITAQALATINNETSASATLGGLVASATSDTTEPSIAAALLGQLTATATATIIPAKKPVSGIGGFQWSHPAPKPFLKPQPIKPLEPELIIEKPKPKVVKPKPIHIVKASASVTVQSPSVYAAGSISWIAELDDLEVLELI
jgi:hypothetical protein